MFRERAPLKKAGCCSKIFFCWVGPLIRFANRHKKLSVDQLGDLRDCDKVEQHIEVLGKIWNRYKHKEGSNRLFRAVIRQFLCEYMLIMFFNLVQTLINILSPFLVKYLIDFIKTGTNPFSDLFDFWDTSQIGWLAWLTKDMQYGICLGVTLNLS